MASYGHQNDGRRRRGPLMMAVAAAFSLGLGALGAPTAGAFEVTDRVTPVAVVAPPDGANVGFAPNVVAIAQGGSLNVVGADTQSHNLACEKRARKTRRPLCQSAYATVGQVVPVVGVEKLPAGSYSLICQLHPKMTLNLTVL